MSRKAKEVEEYRKKLHEYLDKANKPKLVLAPKPVEQAVEAPTGSPKPKQSTVTKPPINIHIDFKVTVFIVALLLVIALWSSKPVDDFLGSKEYRDYLKRVDADKGWYLERRKKGL